MVLRPWGLAPTPTRDSSLDPISGFARTHPRRKAGKGCSCPFSAGQDNPWAYVNRLSRHILTGGRAACEVFHGSIDNSPAPSQPCRFSAYSGWSAGQGR